MQTCTYIFEISSGTRGRILLDQVSSTKTPFLVRFSDTRKILIQYLAPIEWFTRHIETVYTTRREQPYVLTVVSPSTCRH
jgi:hypothetical protein